MNQIKIHGVTVNAEEVRRLIADLQAQLDAPEPVEFWEGQLVEVRDADGPNWLGPRVFRKVEIDGRYTAGANTWGQCRPLQDPLILQFKPHKPGDPMPCDEMAVVRVLFGDGGTSKGCARCFLWTTRADESATVIGWMPADGWGGE